MIKVNTIITMVKPIEGYEELLNRDFVVTKVTDNVIVFKDDTLGGGMISVDEALTYFAEKKTEPKTDLKTKSEENDPYEIDYTPYSPVWTEWIEYNNVNNGIYGYYRYKDTRKGDVRLEFKEDLDSEFIGRACCYRNDEFDLDIGIELCVVRADIKFYRHLMNKLTEQEIHHKKEIASIKTNKNYTIDDLIRAQNKEALIVAELNLN